MYPDRVIIINKKDSFNINKTIFQINIFIIVSTRVEKKALNENLTPRLTKISALVSRFSPIIVKATQGSSISLY